MLRIKQLGVGIFNLWIRFTANLHISPQMTKKEYSLFHQTTHLKKIVNNFQVRISCYFYLRCILCSSKCSREQFLMFSEIHINIKSGSILIVQRYCAKEVKISPCTYFQVGKKLKWYTIYKESFDILLVFEIQRWYLEVIFPSQSRHRLVSNNKLHAVKEIVAGYFTSSLQPAVSLDVCCSQKNRHPLLHQLCQ